VSTRLGFKISAATIPGVIPTGSRFSGGGSNLTRARCLGRLERADSRDDAFEAGVRNFQTEIALLPALNYFFTFPELI
jgi:hypothetical protein